MKRMLFVFLALIFSLPVLAQTPIGTCTPPISAGAHDSCSFTAGGVNYNVSPTLSGDLTVSTLPAGSPQAVIVAGQSLAINMTVGGQYSAVSPNCQVINMNTGAITHAADPLVPDVIGGSGQTTFMPRLCDILMATGKYPGIVLAPIAVGGVQATAWIPGGAANSRIAAIAAKLAAANIPVAMILWDHGETDAGATFGTTTASYMASMQAIKGSFVAAGINAPMYVALETKCEGQGANSSFISPTIRAAQTSLIDLINFLPGPDFDKYGWHPNGGGINYRQDGCHPNVLMVQNMAQDWANAIAPEPFTPVGPPPPPPPPGSTPPTVVGQLLTEHSAASNTFVTTGAILAGQQIIVAAHITSTNGSALIASISDGANTYTSVQHVVGGGNGADESLWSTIATANIPVGTTFTVNATNSVSYPLAVVAMVTSGIAATSTVDVAAQANYNTITTSPTATATGTVVNDLAIGFWAGYTGSGVPAITLPSGFTSAFSDTSLTNPGAGHYGIVIGYEIVPVKTATFNPTSAPGIVGGEILALFK